MGKNRIIHIEDVRPAEFDAVAYIRFREKQHIKIDFHDLMNAINTYLNKQEKNIVLTHYIDGEDFGHIAMRLGIDVRKARHIHDKAIEKLQKKYKKHGGK